MTSAGCLTCFVIAALLSLFLTRWVREIAIGREWTRGAELDRHVHTRPTPRLGGVAICASFVAVSTGVLVIPRCLGLPSVMQAMKVLDILAPALIIFLLGFCDDLRSIGPYRKLGIEAIAAIWLYLGGFGIHELDLFSAGRVLATAIGLPLTVFWVLLITNAFNLIDGLDGLAAGSALFSTVVALTVSLVIPNPMVTCLSVVLAGAILGFLRFNFHPASIFLGDSGSLFIGFVLSALALEGSQKAPVMLAVAIPVISLGLPILDVALSVVRRSLSGHPLFIGDNDHIHHKLLKRGLSQREAVLILYAITAGFALLSLFLMHHAGMIGLVLSIIGVGVWLGVRRLRYVEFAELQDLVRRTKKRKRIFANNLVIRRTAESLNSCSDFTAICRILETTLRPLGFDGFQVKGPPAEEISQLFFEPPLQLPSAPLRYCWHETAQEPPWELKIELIPSAASQAGYFSVFRTRIEDPLLVDIGLFSYEFRVALSNAIYRAVSRVQPAATPPVHEAAAIAPRVAFVSSTD